MEQHWALMIPRHWALCSDDHMECNHLHWALPLQLAQGGVHCCGFGPLDSLMAMDSPLPEPSRWGQLIDDATLPVTNTNGFLWQWQTDQVTGQKQWFAIRRVPEADPPTMVRGTVPMGQTAKAAGTVPMHCYDFVCVFMVNMFLHCNCFSLHCHCPR